MKRVLSDYSVSWEMSESVCQELLEQKAIYHCNANHLHQTESEEIYHSAQWLNIGEIETLLSEAQRIVGEPEWVWRNMGGRSHIYEPERQDEAAYEF